MLLTRTFAPDLLARGLASWPGLDLRGKQPILTSLFGDVFFVAPDGYWYLSVLDGTLTRPWPDREALVRDLDTPGGQDDWLLGGLAMAADRRGVALGDEQVYVFAPHPVLSGRVDSEHIMAMDFVVAMSVNAQALSQAPGSPGSSGSPS